MSVKLVLEVQKLFLRMKYGNKKEIKFQEVIDVIMSLNQQGNLNDIFVFISSRRCYRIRIRTGYRRVLHWF